MIYTLVPYFEDLVNVEVKLLQFSFFCGEGPRSTCYGRTAALRLIAQACDEDD
jgi:hypothetical protein